MRRLALLPLLIATGAFAADTIVVTGKRKVEAERRAQAEAFVRKTAGVLPGGQFARRDSFCPRVIGLAPEYARIVLAKVRQAAQAAGVKQGQPNCRGDLAIVFSADGDALMTALVKHDKAIFRSIPAEDMRAIFAKGRAMRWWYAANPGGADGAAQAESTLIGGGEGKSEVMMMPVWSSSLIATNLKMTLSGSIVVIDVRHAEGLPLASVAAQAAMVSFAQVSPRADFAGLPSVLAMKPGDGEAAPAGLTAWDRAYLHALYSMPRNREAWTQRAAIAAKVAAAIE